MPSWNLLKGIRWPCYRDLLSLLRLIFGWRKKVCYRSTICEEYVYRPAPDSFGMRIVESILTNNRSTTFIHFCLDILLTKYFISCVTVIYLSAINSSVNSFRAKLGLLKGRTPSSRMVFLQEVGPRCWHQNADKAASVGTSSACCQRLCFY